MNDGLARADLPALHGAASDLSRRNQRSFFGQTRAGLALGLLAAACGAISHNAHVGGHTVNATAGAAVLAFGALLVLTLHMYRVRPERCWYQARAVAESVKTLSWQYAMGAGEFPIGPDPATGRSAADADTAADAALRATLAELPRPMDRLRLPPVAGNTDISAALRAVRRRSAAERLVVYRRDRLASQHRWYSDAAERNARWSTRLFGVALVIQLLAVAAGIVVMLTSWSVDLLGIAAAAAATVTAWQQAKDHDNLAEAYRLTTGELADILDEVHRAETGGSGATDDRRVAEIVDSAEQAISREHTMWRARRGIGLSR